MQVQTITNPVYANASGTKIDCLLKWVEMDEVLPFTANTNDSEAHGRAIHAALVAGDFGAIAPFVGPTLAQVKAAIRAKFNKLRESTFASGVTFATKQIDTDPQSVQKINGAVTMALIALGALQPFSIDWTCADDTSITLDANGMIGLGMTVGMYADSLHQRTRTAKMLLDAATTVSEAQAVVW